MELVNIESTLYGRVERPNPAELGGGGRIEDAVKGQRNLIFSDDGKGTGTPVYDGAKIGAGTSGQWSRGDRRRDCDHRHSAGLASRAS